MTQAKKTIVVTGGNSGIGFETAKVLTQHVYRVVITGRDETQLCQAVLTIQAVTHGVSSIATRTVHAAAPGEAERTGNHRRGWMMAEHRNE